MLNITDWLETQTDQNLTPAEILTKIVYEFQIYDSQTDITTIFYATTENAGQLAFFFPAPRFELRPTGLHTEFASKLQFRGWSESDIAETLE